MPKKDSGDKESMREYSSKRDKDKDRDNAASSSSSSRREGDKERDGKERTRASFSDRDQLKKDMERDRPRRDNDRDRSSRASSDRKEASRKEAASADRDRESRHRDKHRDALETETKSPKSKKEAGRSSHGSSSKSSKDHHASGEGSRRESSDTRQESSETSSRSRGDKESRHSSQKNASSSSSEPFKMKRPSLPTKHRSNPNIQPPKSAPPEGSSSEVERRHSVSSVKTSRTKSRDVEESTTAHSTPHEAPVPGTPKATADSAKEKVYATAARINKKSVSSMGSHVSFGHNTEKINSLDYSVDGKHMISSSHDDSITIYDCQSGKTHRTTNSKKYGVDLIRFVRLDSSISTAIHCSTKVDNSIRHLSIDEIKYIRYFSGHQKTVTMLNMLDHSNIFMSGSLDKTVRLWDLRTEKAQAQTNVSSRPVGEFDRDGYVFGIGHSGNTVKLFDIKMFEKGPFATYVLQRESTSEIASLQFCPNGKTILLTTYGDECYLIDSFSGKLLHVLSEHKNPLNIPIDATFTPDGQFIFCGSSDGKLYTYQTSTGALVQTYTTDHQAAINCVKFNPRYFLLATACQKLNFWVPQAADQ
uniref:WD_REPEATS_REGION domain-containing protein n=1 Tax=Steinernema glaseri TaxID=37863 RepID=A0A1I7ZR39_9BILA